MTPNPRIGSLFSGSGMLDEGVRAVLGGSVAWHAEIDPAASRVLAYRYPDVSNLGDISTVDWATVEPVDVITGGSPCQDVSHAGKRAGMRAGTRSGLWARMCDAIEALRPAVVVWENVRGVLSAEADSALEPCPGCVGDGDDGAVLRALGRVLGDLADLGYDTGWHGLRAADVGAPHGRFRVFVVATNARRLSECRRVDVAADACGDESERWGERRDVGGTAAACGVDGEQRQRVRDTAGDSRATAADTSSGGLEGRDVTDGHDGHDGQTDRGRHLQPAGIRDVDVDWGQYGPAIQRWERTIGRLAPAPTMTGPKGGQRLSPRLTEWMMGWPDGWVTDVPGITRNDALKICGNGVCPQQAAEAIRRLLPHLAACAA